MEDRRMKRIAAAGWPSVFSASGGWALVVAALLVAPGCGGPPAPDLVVYSALDGEFSEPILEDFAKEQGINVSWKFDTEAYKTVGLYRAIVEEQKRPRCDVFWNNEILGTLRLQEQGLLQAYESPLAKNYPAAFRSPEGYWHGFAARARVLVVNPDKLKDGEQPPKSILDLTDPRWKGRLAMAKPVYGTTFTHACCLFGHWGDDRAKEFFRALKANDVQIVAGNKDSAEQVATGKLAIGLTDTDDAVVFQEQGYKLQIVYLDRDAESNDLGTLFIPNSLGIIKNCPHPEAARKLIDHLLSAEVETRLAEGASAQIPLATNVKAKTRVETPATVKPMPVDFAAAAKKWDAAHDFLRETFGTD
jgi:iron(III) transport system substrate-binding protein